MGDRHTFRFLKQNWRPDFDSLDAELAEEETDWLLLNAYADGEATPEEMEIVEAKLRADPAYAQAFSLLRMTAVTLRNVPEVEPPPALQNAILAATTQRATLLRRLTTEWQTFCRSFSAPAVRYGLPATALGVTLAAVILWPRQSVPTSPTLASNAETPPAVAQVEAPKPAPIVPAAPDGLSDSVKDAVRQAGLAVAKTAVKVGLPVAPETRQELAQKPKPTDGRKTTASFRPTLAARNTPAPSPNRSAVPEKERITAARSEETEEAVSIASSSYTIAPMNDWINQRRRARLMTEGTSTPADDLNSSGKEKEPAVGSLIARETSAPGTAENTPEMTIDPPNKNGFRRVRFRQSALPPDARGLMTPADIKRIRDTSATASSDWDSIASLQGPKSAALIFGRF
jgi:hypothetical protein